MHTKFKERLEKVKRERELKRKGEREENTQEIEDKPKVAEVFDSCSVEEQTAIIRLLSAMISEDKTLSYRPTIQYLLKHIVNKVEI